MYNDAHLLKGLVVNRLPPREVNPSAWGGGAARPAECNGFARCVWPAGYTNISISMSLNMCISICVCARVLFAY